ncbi:MAG: prephenate dehydratase [Candidatus Methanosuratincola sp.]
MSRVGIEEIRKEIDRIDEEMVRLLNERVAACKRAGVAKGGVAILDLDRERRVLEKVASRSADAPAEGIRSVYREVISMCRRVQRPITVAFLGPEGSFSHEVASKHFGSSSKLLPSRRIRNIFTEVDLGGADLGVVPFENSLEGAVNDTLDCLVEYPVSIVGEALFRINQNLIVDPEVTSLSQIERVYSHPQALAQCDGYITKHLNDKEIIVTESTARAVEHILRDRKGAAIGSKVAAELNELKIFEAGIEDSPNNYTRFVVIKKGGSAEAGKKTSLILSIDHVPGSLAAVLNCFAKHGINVTMILSRPLYMRPWEYLFFLDFEGNLGDEKCMAAIEELRKKTRFLRILGSYSELQ